MINAELEKTPLVPEVRPNLRDLGFILLGFGSGIPIGGIIFLMGDHHVFMIIFLMGLALTGTRLAKSRP